MNEENELQAEVRDILYHFYNSFHDASRTGSPTSAVVDTYVRVLTAAFSAYEWDTLKAEFHKIANEYKGIEDE